MVRDGVRSFLMGILLAAFSMTGSAQAQDAKTVLSKVVQAMKVESVRTLEYSGAGSAWDQTGQHAPLKSYNRQIDLNARTSTIRIDGTIQEAKPDSPWDAQVEFWMTPWGFLKGATANAATAETKSLNGEIYKVVSFTLPGNHKVVGYINDQDLLERVQTTIGTDTAVEGVYRDYQEFRGFKVPTVQIRNRAGMLAQIVIVQDAKITGI